MKRVSIIICVLLISSLWSCQENIEAENTKNNNEVKIIIEDQVQETHYFIEGSDAIEILAQEDDYISKLSLFDYASKYKSNEVLDYDGRYKAIEPNVLNWSEQQKDVINQHMQVITEKLDALKIEIPEIKFVLTSREDEGGAAYTRGQTIVLKPHHITESEGTQRLIVHEIFHVFSRMNKDLRPEMYGVIHYEECEELVIPDELIDLTIANPDAPDNNYYITGMYQDEELAFIPVIYSTEAYDIEKGGSFFTTLRDDMLAVEIINQIPEPIYEDGELLVVTKNEISDYYDKIGINTDYTYHPEETMADNFVLLVYGDQVESQWVIEGLKEIICDRK